MHRPTATTSVSLHWPAPAPASTSWTSAAAAPCTTPPPPTRTESKPRPFRTPLLSCCQAVRPARPHPALSVSRCVEYLLRNNADPGVRDKQGYNAVHYASAYGCTLCLELVRHRCILGNAVQQGLFSLQCCQLSRSLSVCVCRVCFLTDGERDATRCGEKLTFIPSGSVAGLFFQQMMMILCTYTGTHIAE